MIFSCLVIACIIAAFSLGVLFALALPAWFLVVLQSLFILMLVGFIIKPRRR
ncbi:MAG: hypothetical protein UH854_05405 [Clostridia bacterium]|nr:hypothetical protein [Clostridia bacterium]